MTFSREGRQGTRMIHILREDSTVSSVSSVSGAEAGEPSDEIMASFDLILETIVLLWVISGRSDWALAQGKAERLLWGVKRTLI